MQGIREGFRRNGRFLKRTLESRFIRNRNAERGLRQNGIPEAMCRIDGKGFQSFITQAFFSDSPYSSEGICRTTMHRPGLSRCA